MESILSTFNCIFAFIEEQCGNNPEFKVNQVIRSWNCVTSQHLEPRCELCEDEGVAVKYCKDCYKFVDKQCYEYHKKIKDLLGHNLINFRNSDLKLSDIIPKNFCDKRGHTQLETSFYCVNCRKLLCEKCKSRHCVRNHNLNALQDLYSVLDHVYQTKDILLQFISCSPHSQHSKDVSIALTIVRWVERMFEVGYVDLDEVVLPNVVNDILNREKTESNGERRNFVSCKAVVYKLKQIHTDLKFSIAHGRDITDGPFDGARNVTAFSTRDTFAPYMNSEDRTGQNQECVNDDGSASSSLSLYSFEEENPDTAEKSCCDIPARNGNPIVTEPTYSDQTRGQLSKTVEENMEILQAEIQEPFDFNCFQNIHPATSIC